MNRPKPIGRDITSEMVYRLSSHLVASKGSSNEGQLKAKDFFLPVVEESVEQYGATQTRGFVLVDDSGSPKRFYYVDQADTPEAITRIPPSTVEALTRSLQNYDPEREAVMVMLTMDEAHHMDLGAGAEIRLSQVHKRLPIIAPAPLDVPPEVVMKRRQDASGTVFYEFTHTTLGPLGRVSIVAHGVQSEMRSDLAFHDPKTPHFEEWVELFKSILKQLEERLNTSVGRTAQAPGLPDDTTEIMRLYGEFLHVGHSIEIERLLRKLSEGQIKRIEEIAQEGIRRASAYDAMVIQQRLQEFQRLRSEGPDFSDLAHALYDFLDAETDAQARSVLRKHPELLSDPQAEQEWEEFYPIGAQGERIFNARRKLWQQTRDQYREKRKM